jgi:4-hydroxybenzoate polyprenyltransferase
MGINPILEKLSDSLAILVQLTRPSSSSAYLFMLIPLFSLLVGDNIVTSPSLAISLMIPFPFLFAAGFVYNYRCDVHFDSVDKNPLKRGAISKSKANLLVLAFLLTSIFSLLFFYSSIIALLLFVLHLFLGLSYNDLRFRFKESPLGVFIAGFGFYTAPSLYILTHFWYFSSTVLSLLLFIFLTYTSREILHTLLDYEKDTSLNCHTFAVRFGMTKTIVIMHILGLAGWLSILMTSVSSGNLIFQAASFLYGVGYFAIMAAEILSYRLHHSLEFFSVVGRWPFILSRLYLLVFSLVYLELSPLISLLVVLAFLTIKYD